MSIFSLYQARKAANRAKKISDSIDKEILRERTKFRLEWKTDIKVLLLGTDNLAKERLVERLKFSPPSRSPVPTQLSMYRNIAGSAKDALYASTELCPARPGAGATRILTHEFCYHPPYTLLSEASPGSDASPWTEPIILRTGDDVSKCQLGDSMNYLFCQLRRINGIDQPPTRSSNTGITDTKISTSRGAIRVLNVNPRPLQGKGWMYSLSGAIAIIFHVSLSEYDQMVLDGTRLQQSFQLFRTVVNSHCLSRASIILLLDDVDIFEQKSLTAPLNRYFPRYRGGTNVTSASKYISLMFKEVCLKKKLEFYSYTVEGADSSRVKWIIYTIEDIVLRRFLIDADIP